jgi:integrase
LNGEVQARLGHGSIKTTLNVYAHLMPGLGAQLDEALERARNEAWKTSDGLETS